MGERAPREAALVARSPIAPVPPATVEQGWEISARRSVAPLRLTDATPLAKVLVRAAADGPVARGLEVRFGRAARDADGVLVVGSGPGEWLLLAPPGAAPEIASRVTARADGEFASTFDVTHGRALMRLSGAPASDALAKVCAIDLSDAVTPDGAAVRTSVAKLVTDLVRDDRGGGPSYLVHCERSSGQYLFDALLDAGDEFGVDVDGFVFPGV